MIAYTQVEPVSICCTALTLDIHFKYDIFMWPVVDAKVGLFFLGVFRITGFIIPDVITSKYAPVFCQFVGWFDVPASLLITPQCCCSTANDGNVCYGQFSFRQLYGGF